MGLHSPRGRRVQSAQRSSVEDQGIVCDGGVGEVLNQAHHPEVIPGFEDRVDRALQPGERLSQPRYTGATAVPGVRSDLGALRRCEEVTELALVLPEDVDAKD